MTAAPKKMLSGRAAARYLNLPPAHFKRLVDLGEIPVWCDPLTGLKRYPVLALDAWSAAFAAVSKDERAAQVRAAAEKSKKRSAA